MVVVGQGALHYKIGVSDRFVRSHCTEICLVCSEDIGKTFLYCKKGKIKRKGSELNHVYSLSSDRELVTNTYVTKLVINWLGDGLFTKKLIFSQA